MKRPTLRLVSTASRSATSASWSIAAARMRRCGCAGARRAVIHHPWTDHGTQKNIALSHATGDWVLLLDADEIVPPALADRSARRWRKAAPTATRSPACRASAAARCGIRDGYPDYVLRLFRRTRGRFSNDLIHTRVICDGKVARLSQPLIHHPVRGSSSRCRRWIHYSTAGAEEAVAAGKRVVVRVRHHPWAMDLFRV